MAILLSITLFVAFATAFVFLNLLAGSLARPKLPNAEKLEVYECGEPTIGSSWVQFDLRFYIVALVFLVFDVEVAAVLPVGGGVRRRRGNRRRDRPGPDRSRGPCSGGWSTCCSSSAC